MVSVEIKGPKTGESLGRVETPCCEVVVDRVIPKVSHGHPNTCTCLSPACAPLASSCDLA